jgi:hypothetical protein
MYNPGSATSAFTIALGDRKLQLAMPGGGWATVKNEGGTR